MRNINVMQEFLVGLALSMNFDMRKDVCGVFMAKKETLLFFANVYAVNEKGQIFVDIDRINYYIVNVEKINFRLLERREQICDHFWKNGAILRNNATAIYNEAA